MSRVTIEVRLFANLARYLPPVRVPAPASRLKSAHRGGFGIAPSARVPRNCFERAIISSSVFGYFGPRVFR